jgi:carbon storage regulator CsrA
MLVLSRRLNERIVLPVIDTTIQVVAVKIGMVRLGVEAPPGVAVYREEILPPAGLAVPAPSDPQDTQHLIRSRLNALADELARLRRELKTGLLRAAETTLDRLDEELRALHQLERTTDSQPPSRLSPWQRRGRFVEDPQRERRNVSSQGGSS